MKGAFRIPVYGGGSSPDPVVYCPANGYIVDPEAPVDPEYEIPVSETDEKIVLIVSSQLESAISFKCTVSNTGQYTTDVYDMEDNLASSTDTNNNTTINLDLDTADGTLHANGYYLFKIVIYPTIVTNNILSFAVQTRTGYAANGWPLLEAHFYTPELTTLESAFSTLCKMLHYVKFYIGCDSLTSFANAFSQCVKLRECYLPASMDLLESASNTFAYCYALVIVEWPTSLPACTTMLGLYRYGGLKKMTPTINPLPASLPECTTIKQMFDQNHTIEEIEISTNLPKLTDATNFVLWSDSVLTVKFTGALGSATADVNFDWAYGYNAALTEFKYPPTLYATHLSQATHGKQCYVLEKITLPTTIYYTSAETEANILGTHEDCISLDEMTEITAGSWDYCQRLYMWKCKKLATFWQPLVKLYSVYWSGGSSTVLYALSSFECDWSAIETDNYYSGTISFYFRYCSFGATEIDRIFTALPTLTGAGTIDFRNNPGYATCTPGIATAKGWTVV